MVLTQRSPIVWTESGPHPTFHEASKSNTSLYNDWSALSLSLSCFLGRCYLTLEHQKHFCLVFQQLVLLSLIYIQWPYRKSWNRVVGEGFMLLYPFTNFHHFCSFFCEALPLQSWEQVPQTTHQHSTRWSWIQRVFWNQKRTFTASQRQCFSPDIAL